MAETEHEITPAGRIKAPSRHSCVERILAAWESLPSDIIKKSFEVCAISLPTDGSEDEKIHCFQKEGPLSNEREEFTERAAAFYAALGQGAPVDENDPFADPEPDKNVMRLLSTKISRLEHKHYCERLLIQT